MTVFPHCQQKVSTPLSCYELTRLGLWGVTHTFNPISGFPSSPSENYGGSVLMGDPSSCQARLELGEEPWGYWAHLEPCNPSFSPR